MTINKSDVGRSLVGIISAIGDALKSGDSVALVGFGTFEVKERAEQKGSNPQTGA